MNFIELVQQRFSARSYLNQSVEQEKIHQILEAGNAAPTACNKQPQRILVVQSSEGLEKIKVAYPHYSAPCALIVCANHAESWHRSRDGKDSADIDASIVTDHMMLCATDLGVNSVWICAFQPAVLKEAFEIPPHIEPINILFLGYSDGQKCEKVRKPISETVFYEHF